MTLNFLRQRFYIIRKLRKSEDVLFKEISDIREISEVLAICPTPTGLNWMGILRATENLFPKGIFKIPQYYNQQVLSNRQLEQLAIYISEKNFKTIIFSGFTPHFEKIIQTLHANSCKSIITLIHHGGFAEFAENRSTQNAIEKTVGMAQKGHLHNVAFIKKGMAEIFHKLYQIQCFELFIPVKTGHQITKVQHASKGIHIGILGNESFNKNTHSQVVAALLIENSVVHVIDKGNYSYLNQDHRIVSHGVMEHSKFLDLLGSMDINLYLSFSESWGQIITESLTVGVPCMASNNSAIFDNDEELKKLLVINENDNPVIISEKIKDVLANDSVSSKCLQYVSKLNSIAEEKLQHFLNF